MLLKSTSTPILGSLLSSSSSLHFYESPSNHYYHSLERTSSTSPFSRLHHSPSFDSFTCQFSPASDSSDHHHHSSNTFRRAQSDGNLHALLNDSHHHHGRSIPVLESIPSFSEYNSKQLEEDEEEEGDHDDHDPLERSVSIGENIRRELSFSGAKEKISASPLFLARGLGIDRVASGILCAGSDAGGCGGGGAGRNCSVLTGGGGEKSDTEMYYRKMVEENPTNALFLRNYAQFLYETKGDHKKAEEYYSRAILAEPSDGEILSQYAKLVWELHHDEERASTYFEKAVQATPNDSHVLGAYAGFLWETEEGDGDIDRGTGPSQEYTGSPVPHGALASASA